MTEATGNPNERKRGTMTPGMFCGPVDHDWQPDPDRKDEGLCCTLCGMTEAELDAMEHGVCYDGDVPF